MYKSLYIILFLFTASGAQAQQLPERSLVRKGGILRSYESQFDGIAVAKLVAQSVLVRITQIAVGSARIALAMVSVPVMQVKLSARTMSCQT